MAVDAAFSHQGQHLAHALKGRRGEDVGCELDEVRQSGVFANYEPPLTEAPEQRADLFQRRGRACGEYEELSGACKVRIPENRRGDVILTMAAHDPRRPGGTGVG